jgi:hypothetical protein
VWWFESTTLRTCYAEHRSSRADELTVRLNTMNHTIYSARLPPLLLRRHLPLLRFCPAFLPFVFFPFQVFRFSGCAIGAGLMQYSRILNVKMCKSPGLHAMSVRFVVYRISGEDLNVNIASSIIAKVCVTAPLPAGK